MDCCSALRASYIDAGLPPAAPGCDATTFETPKFVRLSPDIVTGGYNVPLKQQRPGIKWPTPA
jgi:hypothetical protein